ncbi:MAG: hypothetical protein KGJ60_02580 [Verrucomicrobiota bacterium]|nr:hypothetical protein [Verrucomicrobiota bacterium]
MPNRPLMEENELLVSFYPKPKFFDWLAECASRPNLSSVLMIKAASVPEGRQRQFVVGEAKAGIFQPRLFWFFSG